MNVEFIPAFYAAFSTDTAIAELRPGVEDAIAVGTFALQREITVFDFTAFERAKGEAKAAVFSHTRFDFLSQMQRAISRPVSASARQRDYIPTQIVAEYLKTFFQCEGVVYSSAVLRADAQDNRNIVLFPNKVDQTWTGDNGVLHFIGYKEYFISDVQYRSSLTPF